MSAFPDADREELDYALEQIKQMLGVDDDSFLWTYKEVPDVPDNYPEPI